MKPVDPFLQLNLRSTGKRPGDTRGQQLSVQIGLRGRAALASKTTAPAAAISGTRQYRLPGDGIAYRSSPLDRSVASNPSANARYPAALA